MNKQFQINKWKTRERSVITIQINKRNKRIETNRLKRVHVIKIFVKIKT